MTKHDSLQSEIPWLALLNCPEAAVLGASAERELLVELADCKNRILAANPSAGGDLEGLAAGTNFQQLVRELADRPAGTDSVSNALVPVAKRYQEIRSKLALANVRLVAHVSKRYQGRGVSPGDLIQEGICSLLSAIDRFEIVNPGDIKPGPE